jgi:hypothetical protein
MVIDMQTPHDCDYFDQNLYDDMDPDTIIVPRIAKIVGPISSSGIMALVHLHARKAWTI